MIKLTNPVNKHVEKKDRDFMKDSFAQDKAQDDLRFKCQTLKGKGSLSREKFIDFAGKRGYLKTAMDKKIVEDIIIKEKLHHDKFYIPEKKGGSMMAPATKKEFEEDKEKLKSL